MLVAIIQITILFRIFSFYWFLQAISLWHISFLLLWYYGIITSRKIVFIPGALTTGKVKGLLSKAYTAFIIVSLLHKMCLCKFTRLKRNFLRVSILLLRYLLENYNESWVLGFSKKMSSKNMLQCSQESRARESNIMEIRKKYNK